MIARGLSARNRLTAQRRAVLQRLVDRATRSAASNPLDQPVYAAETVTVSEASGAGSLTHSYNAVTNASVFDVSGGLPITGTYTDGTTQFARYGSASAAAADNIGLEPNAPFTTTPPYRSVCWRARFWTDAPVIELRTVGSAKSSWRWIVGGQYLSRTPTAMGGNSTRVCKLQFGDGTATYRKPRLIEFEASGPAGFVGVNVDALSSVYAPVGERVDAAFVGDSYTAGTGGTSANSAYSLPAWSLDAARLLGWSAPQQQAIGGTGYLATNSGTQLTFRQRIADLDQRSYDIVVIAGGYNDASTSQTAAATTAEALLHWRAVRAKQPNAMIVVTGVWSAPGAAGSTGTAARTRGQAMEDEIAAQFAAWADPFAAYVPIWRSAQPWLFGTGNTGALVADGNADTYINTDYTHPNDAGHEWLARRFQADLRTRLDTMARALR